MTKRSLLERIVIQIFTPFSSSLFSASTCSPAFCTLTCQSFPKIFQLDTSTTPPSLSLHPHTVEHARCLNLLLCTLHTIFPQPSHLTTLSKISRSYLPYLHILTDSLCLTHAVWNGPVPLLPQLLFTSMPIALSCSIWNMSHNIMYKMASVNGSVANFMLHSDVSLQTGTFLFTLM